MAHPGTLQQVILHFSNPDNALAFAIRMRWPDGVISCPRCKSEQNSFLATRRVWECKGCKKQFSVKMGTVMEESPIGLDKWLCAMWMIGNCKNGISSYEIARDLGITQKSAWFLLHRIRLSMQNGSLAKMTGEVEADETFIGGKFGNMNSATKARKLAREGRMVTGGTIGKAIVMGLLERHGHARVKVVSKRRIRNVQSEIRKHVEIGTAVYTDQLQSYRGLVDDYYHEFIDHTEAYVRGNVHTNGLENFWSLFKRALKGTYVSVEPFHLQAYADEQCFRYNNRKMNDAERFVGMASQMAGKRVTWNDLTGKTLDTSES